MDSIRQSIAPSRKSAAIVPRTALPRLSCHSRFFIAPLRLCVFALEIVCVSLLAGCKVGPDYHRPAPLGTNAMPSSFSSAATNGEWKAAEPSTHIPRGSWWKVFDDAELDRLETTATANNQEIAAALARFDEARASVNVARSDFFPQVEFDPSYVRQRTSANQPLSGHAAGISPTFNTFTLPLQAGWELDLWGRVRRQVESARGRLNASAQDLANIKLLIQAELATDYFTLRALDAEYQLLERTVETFTRSLELTQNRRKGGVASDLDVAQAQTQLRAAEAQLPVVRLQRAKLLHAIATLCGQPATGMSVTAKGAPANAAPALPVSLPSELLERRPDVSAAEQRMAAANAQISVAQTAFYPRVRLNGMAGLQSVDIATLFDWPSRFWAVGPSLQLPLFTGGRNRAQLALAKATYHETVANYRQTVLAAFQEVEDQIAAQQLLERELEASAAALAAAQRNLEIAMNRYKAGLVTYLEVATAQSAALSLERTVVQLRGERLVAAVGLVRAVGGGY